MDIHQIQIMLILCVLSVILPGCNFAGIYFENEYSQTQLLHPLTHKQKKEVRDEIFALLGLEKTPKATYFHRQKSAPKYMMDLYKTIDQSNNVYQDYDDSDLSLMHHHLLHLNISVSGFENLVTDADMIMGFINHVTDLPRRRLTPNKRFYFDFSRVPAREICVASALRMYKHPVYDSDGPSLYTVSVMSIVQNDANGSVFLQTLNNVTFSSTYEGWLDLDVTSAASQWSYIPEKNRGLYMIVKNMKQEEVNPETLGIVGQDGAEEHQAFLVSFFKNDGTLHIRKTRAASRKKKGRSRDVAYNDGQNNNAFQIGLDRIRRRKCQRRSLYVSFHELGWQNWVIAPDGYAAYFCHGECAFPLNAKMNCTNHAVVQNLVSLMHKSRNIVPPPSCAPTKLSPISLLYFDDLSNVILKNYKNMVARACGCL